MCKHAGWEMFLQAPNMIIVEFANSVAFMLKNLGMICQIFIFYLLRSFDIFAKENV